MSDRLAALYEKARREDTPAEERRTTAVAFVQELERKGGLLAVRAGRPPNARDKDKDLRGTVDFLVAANTELRVQLEAARAHEKALLAELENLRSPVGPSVKRSSRELVAEALESFKAHGRLDVSDRDVARATGLSPTTVAKVRRSR